MKCNENNRDSLTVDSYDENVYFEARGATEGSYVSVYASPAKARKFARKILKAADRAQLVSEA